MQAVGIRYPRYGRVGKALVQPLERALELIPQLARAEPGKVRMAPGMGPESDPGLLNGCPQLGLGRRRGEGGEPLEGPALLLGPAAYGTVLAAQLAERLLPEVPVKASARRVCQGIPPKALPPEEGRSYEDRG